MGLASSSSKSNSNSNSNANPNENSDSNLEAEWQWRTADLQWRSYSRACSAAIEAALLGGRPCAEISVVQGSNPTHVVYFNNQSFRQVNFKTRQGRPVRRQIRGQNSTAVWEWWEAKRGLWHEYGNRLASKFEAAWMDCTASRTIDMQDCPAGIFFKLNGRTYFILFEADAVQCNVKTSFCRGVRRRACLQNQRSSIHDLNSNSGAYISKLRAEWQWRTNDLCWHSYPHACTAAIEAAYAAGQSSVEINVNCNSGPTHLICFNNQTLNQVNCKTHRVRPVRRCIRGQTTTAIWEWWEAERSQWHEYDKHLALKFEAAWRDCTTSRTSDRHNCPAGLFFEISGRKYSILFEADATQCNKKTSFCRSVRRCVYLPNQTSSTQPVDMDQCQVSNATLQGQGMENESEQFNMPDCECSDSLHYLDPDEEEECSICLCSLKGDKAVELAKCHHFFHRECIEQWFKTRPTCPQCLTVYDVITGNQPPGKMGIHYIPFITKEVDNGLQGYPGVDIIQITYMFSNGIQTAEHPTPGKPYTGATHVAYLPKNKEGEEVLELLEIAWSRRLLFTVGTSLTTGERDTVVWAGITHKTQKNGGASNHGFPDETYFDKVRKELAAVNVM